MGADQKSYTGGCLCGALRYEASGAPSIMGHCYCADCRKASGSGFIPFLNFKAHQLRFVGEPRQHQCPAARGGLATRNFCPVCGGLVFGGIIGDGAGHSIYAGSLDDPGLFKPSIAIFTRGRPAWAVIPEGLTVFERLPT